jgi:Cd2+/Zn2+-exporting ATPase
MTETINRLQFRIYGMDCAEEVAALRNALGPLVGGEERLSFDILNAKMTVETDRDVSVDAVCSEIAKTGMRAQIWSSESETRRDASFWHRHGRIVATAASAVFLISGVLMHALIGGSIALALGAEADTVLHDVPYAVRLLYALGTVAGAWHVLPKAWRALLAFRPDMNLLMTVAIVGAIGINEWFEAATVSFLFAFSLMLESWSVGRARRAVAALLDLTPPTVRIRRTDGTEQEIPPGQATVGSLFVVRPGERIALDGRVVSGISEVNQAPITGESVHVTKTPESLVFAGTINGDGLLEIECTKLASDTTLAHMIRMVGDAQSKRAPSEYWVEGFARIYTPAVMGLAAAVLILPPLLLGGSWTEWFYRSLILLVIGCPCALVISTPVSIVAALASAARNGVLVKGGVHVETPSRLKGIAFDKTGTLTEGKPAVVQVVPLNACSERELLTIAAAMEARSDHPLARAIVAFARQSGIEPVPADEFSIIKGKGAKGRVRGTEYWLGSQRYLAERSQNSSGLTDRIEELTRSGHSIVVVGDDSNVWGLVALADRVRSEAKRTVDRLRAEGIAHIVMLTGDNEGTAQAIAKQIDVDEVHSGLLPQDKVDAVEKLVARYEAVAMVGDGVNDAPAMALSSLGIAMGAAGSDAAIETADIALMSDDLSKLPWLIQHSKRAVSIIRQNIAFSLSTKLLFVILTFAGYASLWSAIAADMGASLLVIFNALRLLQSPRRLIA